MCTRSYRRLWGIVLSTAAWLSLPADAGYAQEPAAATPAYFTGGKADPTGAAAGYWTTPAPGPVGDGDTGKLEPAGLYDRIAHNLFSINMVWTLVAGFLVMFMQAGFAMVEGGLCRAK